jgi:hypothetical protein
MIRTDRGGATTDDRGQTTLDFAVGVSIFLLTAIFVLTFVPGMLEPFEQSTQEEIAAADRIATDLVEGTLASPDNPHVLDRECTVIFFESREDGLDTAGDDEANINGNGTFSAPFSNETYAGTCAFADLPLEERLALDDGDGAALNVRIRLVRDLTVGEADNPSHDPTDDFDGDPDDDEPSTLCIDANSGHRIVEQDSGNQCQRTGGDDDVRFEIGPEPPSNSDSVVVARRFVQFEGGFADGTSDATLVVEVW